MFGKSEWFDQADNKKLLRPVELKGWTYYMVWAAVIGVPTLLILIAANLPQALVWAGVASIVFLLDYRKMLYSKRQSEAYDRLFFIDDQIESTGNTEQLEIQLKE